MNTKMILEVAGAKPLAATGKATSCNMATAAGKTGGAKPSAKQVLNLPTEKGSGAVCENLGFGNQPTSEGLKLAGLGEGMWKGVFG